MKNLTRYIFAIFATLLFTAIKPAMAQNSHEFQPAKSKNKQYYALYALNSADEQKIAGTLRNIKNALEDPRLKGKLHVELIAFSGGVAVYDKNGPFKETLLDLKSRGVHLVQCENTIRERKIEKSSLYDFINYVPSGNGEIILRHYEGWAIVHP
nr:DsrE family protein [Pedobacter panaciterrae]